MANPAQFLAAAKNSSVRFLTRRREGFAEIAEERLEATRALSPDGADVRRRHGIIGPLLPFATLFFAPFAGDRLLFIEHEPNSILTMDFGL